MPKISTFEAPALALRPSELGVEAMGAAARREGAFFNQVAGATEQVGHSEARAIGGGIQTLGQAGVDYIQHREISQGAATFATKADQLTNQWNDIAKNADPNDPSVAKTFREQVLEPELEKIRTGFITEGGQKWAEAHVDALRTHMFEKTSADMATLAGQAAKVNTAQTINTLSNTVYNDPSALDFSLKSFETSVNGIVGSSPNLKGTAAAAVRTEIGEKGREQIVKAAAVGYIEKTGEVPAWVTDPAYSKYVNGVELRQFQKAADAQKKANLYYERQTEVLNKQRADLAVHKDATDLLANGVTVDPNNAGRVIIAPDFMRRAIDLARRNPDAPSAAATARTMIDWAESQQRQRAEPVVSDQTVKADLLSRIGSPDNPTNEMQVLDWAARDKLSTRDTTLLREMVKSIGPEAMRDPLVHSALQGASERAGVGLMNDGHQRYSNFLQAFWPEYLRQKNAGTLKPNALDFNDETSLIRQTMKTYEPTREQRLNAAVMRNLQGAAQPAAEPPPALPATDQRRAGQVYQTARGPMKWTGTGWVNP